MTLLSCWNGFLPRVQGKELVATHEWQRIGPNDTLPAGMEIRIDMTTGEKWARLLQPSDEGDDTGKGSQDEQHEHPHAPRCGPSCKERQKQRAARRRGLRGQRDDNDAANHDEIKPQLFRLFFILFLGAAVALGIWNTVLWHPTTSTANDHNHYVASFFRNHNSPWQLLSPFFARRNRGAHES